VVIYDFDVLWAGHPRGPLEANSPLLIYADGELALAVAPQSFQTVARQRGKVGEIGGGLQNAQPLFGLSFETMKCRDEFALRKLSRPFVPVAQYHPGKYK
jgi:hypothetical protein